MFSLLQIQPALGNLADMTAFTLATNIIAQRRALDGSAPAEHEEEEGEGADVMCTFSTYQYCDT